MVTASTHHVYIFVCALLCVCIYFLAHFSTEMCNNWHAQHLFFRLFRTKWYAPADVAHAICSDACSDSINLIVFSAECLTILANQEHYAIWINVLASIWNLTAHVRNLTYVSHVGDTVRKRYTSNNTAKTTNIFSKRLEAKTHITANTEYTRDTMKSFEFRIRIISHLHGWVILRFEIRYWFIYTR